MKHKMHVLTLAVTLAFITNACMFLKPPLPPEKGQNLPITKPQPQAVVTQAQVVSPSIPSTTSSTFTLTSSNLPADRRLPAEYTCDGASSTLALAWNGAPAGTQGYAVIMHHVAPEGFHWYWVLYNIPANVTSLPKNMTGIGTLGTNSVNDRNEYAPPCSKGPGDKEYIYTVYALSAQPQITISPVNRAVLLDAIKDITLASAELHVVYARP
jgi:Raf kinase inhibitor-like YbhB/YbcL family protein